MSKSKKIIILCIAVAVIMTVAVSVSFAFWDKTSAAFDFDTVSAAGSVKLTAKAVGTYDKTHKLMPADALIDTTTETKVLRIGGFRTNLTDPANVETTESDIASRIEIEYFVNSFKVGDNDITNNYSDTFEIIINTDPNNSGAGVLNTNVITNDTDYYVWIQFKSTVKADNVISYKNANISVKFTLKAEKKQTA